MKRTKSKPTRKHEARNQLRPNPPEKSPFIAHVVELRKRLFYIAVSVGLFGACAVYAQNILTQILLEPAGKQQFIYTTPGGGFDFLFRLCLYTGIAASIPVIIYHILRYIQPLFKQHTSRFIIISTACSSILAVLGILFGYFIGLPAAMHFLLQGFSTEQIKALISIQSYMSFVMTYLLGAALLFQIPLILILINRLKPLQPKKLMKLQRWFIAGAFVIGAIISPTPDIRNQLILSGPIILMYELSIVLIWAINRRGKRPKKVVHLMQQDEKKRAERQANFEKAQDVWRQLFTDHPSDQAQSTAAAPISPAPAAPLSRPTPQRPNRYLQDFRRRPIQYKSSTPTTQPE